MNFEGTFPPQCFWLLQSCIWSQVLKCCVYYEASVYKCNLTVFTLSLLEYKHCSIWLVYIFRINFNKFDLFLSRCCCRPSVIFISMHLLAGKFTVRTERCCRAGSGQDEGKLVFASQVSLILMVSAELLPSRKHV